MAGELADMELRRGRWRRIREPLGLVTTADGDFATGGLAGHIDDLSVRFLILPGDPEAALVRFDDLFWTWWKADRESPFPGLISWGHDWHPTGEAAVCHDERSGNAWSWETYLAVHRSGGLEFGLGRAGTYEYGGVRVFRLIEAVGRIWAAVAHYGDLLDRIAAEGPWLCALGLRGTEGALLGNVAHGWAEPGNGGFDLLPCPEPHVLIVREVMAEWPRGEEARALAFDLGSAMDEAWGSLSPRFIARRGPTEGEFDWQMYHGTA